jgi:delta 1-pyrroline-5-carboxylate dehydrogenase
MLYLPPYSPDLSPIRLAFSKVKAHLHRAAEHDHLKASEETPAGAVQLARAFHDAGLPPGVLNLVFGTPSEMRAAVEAFIAAA